MSREMPQTARSLTTSKEIALSTARLQSGSFKQRGAFSSVGTNVRERRVTVSFPVANAPVPVYHGLGFAPSGFTVLASGIGTGNNWTAPGKIYSDMPLLSTSRTIVLKCDTANTVADVLIR